MDPDQMLVRFMVVYDFAIKRMLVFQFFKKKVSVLEELGQEEDLI